MPKELDVDDKDEGSQAMVRLTIASVGVREDDPQYYDSENESDADAVEASDAADSENESEEGGVQLSTQFNGYPTMRDFDKYHVDTFGLTETITHEQFTSTRTHTFLVFLHAQTHTELVSEYTIDAAVDCLTRLQNPEIIQEAFGHRTGHALKGLMITIWLIICLKAHNNLSITPYLHARKHCAALARTAVELYHDSAQEGPSKSLLRLSLTYWERRIRETYAYSQTTGYVLWDQIRWWKAISSLPNLFQDKEDTLQNHLHRLWEEEGLTAMTNYCLTLDLEAGNSPLARYEAPEYTLSRSRRMLGSMDPLLLAACVRGTVASLAETQGDPVRKELQVIAAREDVSPGTYANFFTDHSGMALTPAQLQVVVRNMRRYLNLNPSTADLNWIWKIDRMHYPKKDWSRSHVDLGLRRYTDWRAPDASNPSKPFKRSDTRRSVLYIFVEEVENVIAVAKVSHRFHAPCARPLTEVGYAKRPNHRLSAHHAKHVQSNYIMNLFHVLMMEAFHNDFRLQQVVIYSCWRSGQAWLSETILTRILQGYTAGGKGMSHYRAGLSNWSASRYVGDEVWHKILGQANILERVSESYETEIEQQRQRSEEMEAKNRSMAVSTGPIHPILKGSSGKKIHELLDSVLSYILGAEDTEDA